MAFQLRNAFRHLAKATPQDAVAIQSDGTESQTRLMLQDGVVLAHVDYSQVVIASKPNFMLTLIHGTNRHISKGIEQLI